jgi:hypothetical protein
MDEEEGRTIVDRPIPVQIQERALDLLREDDSFDDSCLSQLRALARSGRLSQVQEVIEILRGKAAP